MRGSFNNDSDESDYSNITQENELLTKSKSNKVTNVKKTSFIGHCTRY